MNEFRVECYIGNTKLSNLDKKDLRQWKLDIEVQALSEYYKKKVKISDKRD